MKISQKLSLLVLLTAMLPLIGVGAYSYSTTQKAFQKKTAEGLTATSDRHALRISNQLNLASSRLNIFSNRLKLRLLIDQYNTSGQQATLDEIKKSLTNIVQDEQTFERIQIVNPSGVVIASTGTMSQTLDRQYAAAFEAAKTTESSDNLALSADGIVRQVLATPLTLERKLISVALIDVPIDAYSFILRDYSSLGATGESYLLWENRKDEYKYVSPLRFDSKASLKVASETPISKQDYRNRTVEKTSRPLQNGWVLVTKTDTSEVNAPVDALRNGTIQITVVTLLLVGLIGLILGRLITQPIKRFTDTVSKIKSGDLSQRVVVNSRDELGTLGSAFNAMTDDLMESRVRLGASIAALKQAYLLVDKDGNIEMSNEAAWAMLQVASNNQLWGKSLSKALSSFENFDTDTVLAKTLSQQALVEIADVKSGSSMLRIFCSPVTIKGEADGVVVLIVDETEAHIIQRSRDEFFSIASHELRTPLTAIRGNTSMIKEFYPEVLKDDSLREMIEDIHGSSTRLIDIVNDFLDVSRLEQGKIEFKLEAFDIEAVIQQVVFEMKAVADEKHTTVRLKLSKNKSPQVYGDKDRIKQVVYNLIGNALKFTPDGTIDIVVTKEADMLKIIVNDSGTGMNEESQKLLFHKFQQATDNLFTRDTSRGTGLGLYISKILVEKMGGRIVLEHSTVNKGSAFSFSIPVATAQQQADTPSASS